MATEINIASPSVYDANGRLLIKADTSVTTQTSSVIQADTTNANLVLAPNGTGSILASIPDGTTTGGNARASYALDLQTIRLAADQIARGQYSAVLGGFSNTAAGIYSVTGGRNNFVSGNSASAFGYENSATNSGCSVMGWQNSVTGGFASALGFQNNVGGQGAFAAGQNNTASGQNSIALGLNATANSIGCFAFNGTASGVRAIAIGSGTNSSNDGSVAIGRGAIASGSRSVSIGDQTNATAVYSQAFGRDSLAYLQGQTAFANNIFLNLGDAQQSNLTARSSAVLTTAATVAISLDGTGTTNLIIPTGNNRAWNVTIETIAVVTAITGTATGVSVGNCYRETKQLLFKRVGGTSSIVGTVDTTAIKSDSGMSTAILTVTAGGSQEMALTFTAPTFLGGGSVTFRVVSKVMLVECAY